MDRFALTNDLLTGVHDIDEQHRQLFQLANQLIDANSSPSDRIKFIRAMAFLGGYIDYHFAAEELTMQDTRFPSYEEHRTFHESFREQLGDIAEEARTTGSSDLPTRRITALLTDWLITHIRIMDRAFAEYLVSQSRGEPIHLPGQERLVQAGLVPADYALPAPSETREE